MPRKTPGFRTRDQPISRSSSQPPTLHLETVLAREVPFLGELCHLLPKIDLHQHMTGSMPNDEVIKVLETIEPTRVKDVCPIPPMHPSELPTAWDMLVRYCDAVGVAQRDLEHLDRLLAATIERLARDNVIYCELRAGLKATPTKRAFLERLNSIIERQKARFPGTTVKLLISVARHVDLSEGAENVDIAIESFLHDPHSAVCGVELGGVAHLGSFDSMRHIFQKARDAGLPVALHCGEDKAKQHEWKEIIDFAPERLGHCVHCDDENLARIIAAGIPVETCLTCHQRHFGVPLEENIFSKMYPSRQVVVCTDNPSLYEAILSDEYQTLCRSYDLTISDLFQLARQAVDFTFQSQQAKNAMLREVDRQIEFIRDKLGIRSAPASKL